MKTFHVLHPDVPGPVGSYDNHKDAKAHAARLDKPGLVIAVASKDPDQDSDADKSDDDFDDQPGNEKFHLPKDHQPAMQVPKGGACCANCNYYQPGPGNGKCGNEYYAQFYGKADLPSPPDEFCSDWYEQGQQQAAPAPEGMPS